MSLNEWIAEFRRICPVKTDNMDFNDAALIAIENGVSPQAMWDYISALPREALEKLAGV